MTDFVLVALFATMFRITIILIGFGFAVLGYKLFRAGVYEHATDLRAAWGDRHLVLKQAAPGTLFAIFGVAVIAISMFRELSFENTTNATNDSAASAASRTEETILVQALAMLNLSDGEQRLLKAYDPLIDQLLSKNTPDKDAIESLFLTTVGRLPTELEIEQMTAYLATAVDKGAAYKDLLWALLNTPEYIQGRRFRATPLERAANR